VNPRTQSVTVGIVGIGTVGAALLDLFETNDRIIRGKAGCDLRVGVVCDKRADRVKIARSRGVRFSTDYRRVTDDPSVDIVVELVGGTTVAGEVVMRALENGKHVVTANKALLASRWDAVFSLARQRRRAVYFEGAVAGSIPVVQALNEGLAGNHIRSITGILNGTTNYILTTMTASGRSYATALTEAQRRGFAEADPTMDVTGADTAHKLAILSSIAYSRWVKPSHLRVQGIREVEPEDISFARGFGYVMKLLGRGEERDGAYHGEVRPYLIPSDSVFATVHNEFNAVMIQGSHAGDLVFVGRGAGGAAAASAVLSDVIYVARGTAHHTAGLAPYVVYDPDLEVRLANRAEVPGSFYIRCTAVDRPGVLAQIAAVLGRHQVSLASVYQKQPITARPLGVPVVMLTHRIPEGRLESALAEIGSLTVVKGKPAYYKILDSAGT